MASVYQWLVIEQIICSTTIVDMLCLTIHFGKSKVHFRIDLVVHLTVLEISFGQLKVRLGQLIACLGQLKVHWGQFDSLLGRVLKVCFLAIHLGQAISKSAL